MMYATRAYFWILLNCFNSSLWGLFIASEAIKNRTEECPGLQITPLVLLVWDNLNCTLVNTNMYFGSIKKDNNVP